MNGICAMNANTNIDVINKSECEYVELYWVDKLPVNDDVQFEYMIIIR